MSGDKIQRQMDFISEQQARFDQQFDQKMLELEEKQRQNTEDIAKLVGAVMNLTIHTAEKQPPNSAVDRARKGNRCAL